MDRSPARLASMLASTPSTATEPSLARPARRSALRAAAAAAIAGALPLLGASGMARAAMGQPRADGNRQDASPDRPDPPAARSAGARPTSARYLAARRRATGFEAAVIDASGRDLHTIALTDRGHSFALDPDTRRVVAFGRQPGFFATAFHLDGGEDPISLDVAPGRHFFGHGVFADAGRLLLATENDYEAGRGVLGVYDAGPGGRYRRLSELPTGGVGPHEVVALPGTGLVVVANGGILTHPDYGKMSLNLPSMQPSLTYLDVATGDIVETVSLPPELHQLSIRHMVVDAGGRVWFGCQYMGPPEDMPPLVGYHQRGRAIQMLEGSAEVLRSFRNYIGSMAVDATGGVVATSSPVGGLVAYWDAGSGRLLGTTALPDGCGVAPGDEADFLLTSGTGELVRAGPALAATRLLSASGELAWDNHLRRFPSA
jgi:hypothetical protein